MTEQEQLVLDGVLRGEHFICVFDGYAYFLGPEALTPMGLRDACAWCKSLGDGYELPSKEILNECYKNESIRKARPGTYYWSSSPFPSAPSRTWHISFSTGTIQSADNRFLLFVVSVRKIKI